MLCCTLNAATRRRSPRCVATFPCSSLGNKISLSKVSPSTQVCVVAPRWPHYLSAPPPQGRRPSAEQVTPLGASLSTWPSSTHAPSFLKDCARQTGRCLRAHVTAVAARSLLRSRRLHRSAPRLATWPAAPGQGHKILQRSPREGVCVCVRGGEGGGLLVAPSLGRCEFLRLAIRGHYR